MLGGSEPLFYFGAELVHRHAGKRGDENLFKVLHRKFRHCFPVAGEHGLEWLRRLEFRFLFHQRRHALQAIHYLRVHWVLYPKRPILVERSDAIFGRDILGVGLVGHLLDECQDGLLGGAVVPRRQWVLALRAGGSTDSMARVEKINFIR